MTNVYLGDQIENGLPLPLPLTAYDRGALYLGPTGCGKTFGLLRTAQELIAQAPKAAVVFLDVKGSAATRLSRWVYEQSLDDRLLPINPNDRRMVAGFNPVHPWDDNHELQARVARELFLRAIGQSEALLTPRQSRWLENLTYALIKLGLTLAEALLLFSYSDNSYRRALVPLLPPGSPVRSDFEWLIQVADHGSQGQMMRILDEHLGAAVNRLRHVLGNPALRAMYGAERSIDFSEVVSRGLIVPVNLQPRQLDREAQRLLGLQIINEIVREAFSRRPEERVPIYLIVDEAHLFATPELIECLDMGREVGLRVILATQYLGQFRDPVTGDRRLLDSVLTDARLKVVFGGLSPEDGEEMARVLWGHHLDPDKRQLVLETLRQLSRVTTAHSRSTATSEADTQMEAEASTEAEAESSSFTDSIAIARGTASASGVAMGLGSGLTTDSAGVVIGGMENQHSGSSDISGSSDSEVSGSTDSWSSSRISGTTKSRGRASTRGKTESQTEGPMVVPTSPFSEISSVQIEPLETQLWRREAELIRQPDRCAVVVEGKGMPVAFRFATVAEPLIDEEQAAELDLQVMQRRTEYSDPQVVEFVIAERQARLLDHPRSALPTRGELDRRLRRPRPEEQS